MSEDNPERNLAARLIRKKGLVPPIDIFKLAKQYAKVELIEIPFKIDGISLYLKVPGQQPHIILNRLNPERRIRFTLAHELGHVLIPWHIGSIIDNTLVPEEDKFDDYWYIESEANSFASELLMPSSWVKKLIKSQNYDLFKITRLIVDRANVSSHAATIKIKDCIGPGYLFVAINEDKEVIFSGRSNGTLAAAPSWGEEIKPDALYPFCKMRFDFEINGFSYYWWAFDESLPIPETSSIGDWREILDRIINDIGIPPSNQHKFKQSLNGVISYANSQVRGSSRTYEALYSASLQRLYSHPEFRKLIKHKKFNDFLYSKIDSLLRLR